LHWTDDFWIPGGINSTVFVFELGNLVGEILLQPLGVLGSEGVNRTLVARGEAHNEVFWCKGNIDAFTKYFGCVFDCVFFHSCIVAHCHQTTKKGV